MSRPVDIIDALGADEISIRFTSPATYPSGPSFSITIASVISNGLNTKTSSATPTSTEHKKL